MKFFGKVSPTGVDPATLTKAAGETRERLDLFLESIRTLFLFVREYTLDISEIDTEGFKKKLDALQEKFQENEKTKTCN